MPTRKPVNIRAQVAFFSPKPRMRTMAIFCAAPLLATSLPNIAPIQTMPNNPPSRPGILSTGRPSSAQATAEATRNARNGCTLPQLMSSTSSTIEANTYQISITPPDYSPARASETRAFDVESDARQHVVRGQVQRLAIVTELAVGRGLAIDDAAQAFAFLRQHEHAARTGGEDGAVFGDREAVGQSRRVFPDELSEIVEQFAAGDV